MAISSRKCAREWLAVALPVLLSLTGGCGRSTAQKPAVPVSILPVQALVPIDPPPPKIPVDISPERIVRFPIVVRYRDNSGQEDDHDEDCGELLLHPASGRFVYRLWHDWPNVKRMYREWIENPDERTPEYRECLQGAAGFDGTHYWRVRTFPRKFRNSKSGSEALLLNSWDEVLEFDLVTNRMSNVNAWGVAAPLHIVFAALNIKDFGREPLHQALHKATEIQKKQLQCDTPIYLFRIWGFGIAKDQSEFGFSQIDGGVRGGGTGAWPYPLPLHFVIRRGETIEMPLDEFDRACDHRTYLAKDAIITNVSELRP